MFDSPSELIAKMRLGKDSLLEMKSLGVAKEEDRVNWSAPEIADDLAAFANTRGGVMVLGVDGKTREPVGIPRDKLELVETFVRELCSDAIVPPLQGTAYRVELPDSTGVILPVLRVEVPRSLFIHRSPGGYLWRQGSRTRPIEPACLARVLQQRSQVGLARFEQNAVPSASFGDLSRKLWQRFTSRAEGPDEVVLMRRKLLTRDDEGRSRASVAGVLMCCETPERFVSGAFIEAVRYRGVVQDAANQLDAARICGSLDQQVRQAMAFLLRNQRVAASKRPQRIDHPQFSLRAVFEAVVNAVAHRDYSIEGSKIRLFMFDDRLELYSPGDLPGSVSVESLPFRQVTRNELLTSLLAECPVGLTHGDVGRGYCIEKRGDGVPIIFNESEALSGKKPVYRMIDDSELLLTVFSATPPVRTDAA